MSYRPDPAAVPLFIAARVPGGRKDSLFAGSMMIRI